MNDDLEDTDGGLSLGDGLAVLGISIAKGSAWLAIAWVVVTWLRGP